MPTAGEARLIANKRAKSPDPNNNNPTPNKKTCDPRAESAIPRPIEVAFGKRATLKPTVQPPTEAQLKQIEITQKAQEEQDALAAKAAAAKAAKNAAPQDTAGIPEAIPAPGPVPSTSTFPHPTIPDMNPVNNPRLCSQRSRSLKRTQKQPKLTQTWLIHKDMKGMEVPWTSPSYACSRKTRTKPSKSQKT